jgi:hypothetical protein
MEQVSAPLALKEMQIKTTQLDWPPSRKQRNAGEDVGKTNYPLLVGM